MFCLSLAKYLARWEERHPKTYEQMLSSAVKEATTDVDTYIFESHWKSITTSFHECVSQIKQSVKQMASDWKRVEQLASLTENRYRHKPATPMTSHEYSPEDTLAMMMDRRLRFRLQKQVMGN
ncbi:hypothetical protein DICA0_F12838 [Diutina catenulata]